MTRLTLPRTLSQLHRDAQRWGRRYWVELALFISGLIVIHLALLPKEFREGTFDKGAASQFGDFVGGYIGTLFSLASVALLLGTLRAQQRDKEEQSFETRYMELIKMHRDNVAEIELGEARSRKVFVLLVRELRKILPLIRTIAVEHNLTFTQLQALHIAYYCLYFGTGPNSSRMLKSSLSSFPSAFVDGLEALLNNGEEKSRLSRGLGYWPFEGHQSRLGHYYRHLYQAVRFVDRQQGGIDRYDLVKMLRAQLSTHEQALLLINSLTPMGRAWWADGLITKYRLVRNLPLDFLNAETELDIRPLFGANYFEWAKVADIQAAPQLDGPPSSGPNPS